MIEYFKNKKHTFEATINEIATGVTIKIGGAYKDCINITLVSENNIVSKGRIPHLESEPECGFTNLLEEGDTVEFIKASLQYISMKYPTVKRYEFDDNSNIECGIRKSNIPPRKMSKPFSLAHLYLALYGETWYEKRFGAKMLNSVLYDIYKDNRNILNTQIHIPYEQFKKMNTIDEKQDKILSQYYDINKTWTHFFNSIPKKDRCVAFFNWLQFFIKDLLHNTYISSSWFIDIDTMDKTHIEIVESMSGGQRKKTRKYKKFSNSFQTIIFDE